MSTKEPRSCGVLVVRGDPIQEFLLMQHPNRLDLPKGHVDPGESDVACALRELEEETGIKADDIELDPNFQFKSRYMVRYKRFGNQEVEKTLVIFLGRLKRDVEIAVSEHESFKWVVWNPPHKIQKETIDPLLAQLAKFVV